ncbi:MAG: hypothetical protein WCT14_10635 [Treponemataceae bacterium]
MIDIERKIGILTYRRLWFADCAPGLPLSGFTSLRQFAGTEAPRFWTRHEFHTILIDLSANESTILGAMKKNTSYEIRRAEKDGIESKTVDDIEAFRSFFNDFAPTKSLKPLSGSNLKSMAPFLTITEAIFENRPLVMHAYLVDEAVSRARLLYSATVARTGADGAPTVDPSLLGRANRRLHWTDMLLFKAKGFRTYDLGGIAGDPSKADTAGIDSFKLAFGGVHAREDNFDSPLLSIAQSLKRALTGKKK